MGFNLYNSSKNSSSLTLIRLREKNLIKDLKLRIKRRNYATKDLKLPLNWFNEWLVGLTDGEKRKREREFSSIFFQCLHRNFFETLSPDSSQLSLI